MYKDETLAKIRETVFKEFPIEVGVTRIELLGPEIVVYVKRPDLSVIDEELRSRIAKTIMKRIEVRTDPSSRLNEEDARKFIEESIPPEAEVSRIEFDKDAGIVYIEARNPGLARGRGNENCHLIFMKTGWTPEVLDAKSRISTIVQNVRELYLTESAERYRFLRRVGERIHRAPLFRDEWVRITALGGFGEVGRSALLIETRESSVLVDCGIKPGATSPREIYPYLDSKELDLCELDAVIVTHAHLDHCGFVPYLFKYGYDGPVYCTEPTRDLMLLLQKDLIEVASREGMHPPYEMRDIKTELLHTISLPYGRVTNISPDVRITLRQAGHVLGSAMVHLHVGEGAHNLVVTGDFKYGRTRLLDSAATAFPRVETLIMESTYGGPRDIMPPRAEAEKQFVNIINETLAKGGIVLIPVLAVGRAQEVMLILDYYIRNGRIPETPIYLDGMISEATRVHYIYENYLSRSLKEEIRSAGYNPFSLTNNESPFITVKGRDERFEIVEEGPSIILATSGMLSGGPVLEYLKLLAEDEKNTLIFVSYQIEGTLGRKIQGGLRKIQLTNENGKTISIDIRMRIETNHGFSGHSDRRQLTAYVRRMNPPPDYVIIGHGEPTKAQSLASAISHQLRIKAQAILNLDSVRTK